MGRNAKMKRERRVARAAIATEQKRSIGFAIAPCSFQRCKHNRPPGTHILWRVDGQGHYTACDDCVQHMMQALKFVGIDIQVVTVNALAHMRHNEPQGPAVKPDAEEDVERLLAAAKRLEQRAAEIPSWKKGTIVFAEASGDV
jgi:hypothetical protein